MGRVERAAALPLQPADLPLGGVPQDSPDDSIERMDDALYVL